MDTQFLEPWRADDVSLGPSAPLQLQFSLAKPISVDFFHEKQTGELSVFWWGYLDGVSVSQYVRLFYPSFYQMFAV